MALYKRTPFTIGPGWEPKSDPQEAEALARAKFQAQQNAYEQSRADAKRSEHLKAMQRLLQQEEDQQIRTEDQALDERDFQRKLNYEINPKNERDAIELASSLAYRADKLDLDQDRNRELAAQGAFKRRQEEVKRAAAAEQAKAETAAATREAEIEARTESEEADRQLERDKFSNIDKLKALHQGEEIKRLKREATEGVKGQKAKDAELSLLLSPSGIGGGEETAIEKVQLKLNRGETPSYDEITSLYDAYRLTTYPETKQHIVNSLRNSFARFKSLKESEIKEKEKEASEGYGIMMDKVQKYFSKGDNKQTRSAWERFKDSALKKSGPSQSQYNPKEYVNEQTAEFRQKIMEEIQIVEHLLERFPGAIPPQAPWRTSSGWGSP